MEKIKLFAKKLKTFTLDDITTLSEMDEKLVAKALDILVEEKYLIKKENIFIYVENGYLTQVEEDKYKELPTKNSTLLMQVRCLKENPYYTIKKKRFKRIWKISDAEFDNAHERNKAIAYKYLKLLELTDGLNGEDLKEKIAEINQKYPEIKTSLACLLSARKNYAKYGRVGLLGTFGIQSQSSLKTKCYKLFKELYLSPLRLSQKACVEEVARYFNLAKIPSRRSYMQKLKKK